MSPCWLDLEHGVTLRERAEADVVRAMIERSRRVIVIATETKLGSTGPYVVADDRAARSRSSPTRRPAVEYGRLGIEVVLP